MTLPEPTEVRVTVDGARFNDFVRSLKRAFKPSTLGEIVMAVEDGKFVIHSAHARLELPCAATKPVRARLHAGNFLRLTSLAKHSASEDKLRVVFRPELGEIGFPVEGARAKFD
jgi:hypothetical protein